ncbi:MAG: DMT family protein [Bdellovibrionota bacterium]
MAKHLNTQAIAENKVYLKAVTSKPQPKERWKYIVVPLMLLASSLIMSFAWLGHLRFKSLSFGTAIVLAWLLVLPEYLLNISALRMGYGIFHAGFMGALNVATGVICVAAVSYFFLGEVLSTQKLCGFALMAVSLIFIFHKKKTTKGSK